jgi:hypothetical protein
MTETPGDWRFPAVCPTCLAKAGNPVRVDASPASQIVVLMRCDDCEFQWHITASTPPLLLKAKIDRRVNDKK